MVIEAETFEFVTEDEDCLSSVYFANRFDAKAHSYVALCRDHHPENGDDRIYIECGDQIWATYDGIVKCSVSEAAFDLEFDATAARNLGEISHIRVLLRLTAEQKVDFYRALQAIFRGKNLLEGLVG